MPTATCLNKFCNEKAEFTKGRVKWVMKCKCGTQFYQSQESKAAVEKYLAEQKPADKDDKKPDENSKDTSKDNGGKPPGEDGNKPKPTRRFGRFTRGAA